MPHYFSFEFGYDHPHKPNYIVVVEKRFDFLEDDAAMAELDRRISYEGEGQERTEELEEKYGIHDYVTSGVDNFHGYTTTEVDPQKIDELMELWRQHFITRFGVRVGKVYESHNYEQRLEPIHASK